jgi:transcriptional regulator with XRE-family HTH domain
VPRARKETVGQRIARFRRDRGLTLSQLAAETGLSKSYLSELEKSDDPPPATGHGPSADAIYRIAKALGVAMSDLLGRPIITAPQARRSASLLKFADKAGLPEADVEMLANIQFRGEPPKTEERWEFIYRAIRASAEIDG